MGEKVQPSESPEATALAVAWDIVLATRLPGADRKVLVSETVEIAKQLLAAVRPPAR